MSNFINFTEKLTQQAWLDDCSLIGTRPLFASFLFIRSFLSFGHHHCHLHA
ncbi:hypothetical protein [Candidatus Protochlamydia phocaeensis]|uniref:hypothetical protein n=1 Tax=Candidatus Protochlamydia phocaeensis TaxID=1414722 RepID=UPI000ACA3B80|nr:hypothetical protein [Candidatus Protochlamydia phocaeensis]